MRSPPWLGRGDINAFFGLALDNVAVLIILLSTIAGTKDDLFTPRFVLERMVPGTAVGVVIGDLVFAAMAIRLGRRTNRSDVTAMPLGLDTPSTFAVALLVLLPALRHWLDDHPGDRDTAMVYAWHVGALVLVICGVLKSVAAPCGQWVRRNVPRAGLLGSLAAVALLLIAFLPLLTDVAKVPPVGLASLVIILVTLVAHRRLPGNLPGALAAVLVGVAIYYAGRAVGAATGWPLVPNAESVSLDASAALAPLPADVWQRDWWERVVGLSLEKLPLMLPFALATVVGGIDCTESAAAAGDDYDTTQVLLTEGVASIAAGLCGGVIQTTPYIGHPAYKAMGGRSGYTLATALFIGAAGFLGAFTLLFEWLPEPALFPILIFVGLEITAQSFHATPTRHYPAVALAMLPALAYLITVPLGMVLAGKPSAPSAAGMVQTLTWLANGVIVTSLLWGAALAAIIDGRLRNAAIVFGVASACSLFGVIHSPLVLARIDLPQRVMAQLPPAARYQTPYHWAGTYLLVAMLLQLLAWFPSEPKVKHDEGEIASSSDEASP